MNTNTSVADYWDKYVGSHLNNPAHWEANSVVQQYQNAFISGDPFKNALEWFMEGYGPFGEMASICCGSGILEKHMGVAFLKGTNNRITGFDISPGSIKVAEDNCVGLQGVSFKVRDANHAEWDRDYLDAAFAHGALHHIEKLDHCLGQLKQALKPTGLLYVNDYVGPRRFQWTDVQFRLAQEAVNMIPAKYRNPGSQVHRCDPIALKAMDPSEAVRSDHILDHIHAHFNIKEIIKRGGTLLAPIFGSGCISPKLFESTDGMIALQKVCDLERNLIDSEILPSDHVLVVASPRKECV